MSIRRKLVTSLIVVVVPVAILGIITFRLAEDSLRSEVDLGLERLALNSAERIDSHISSVTSEVENLAGEDWIKETAASQQGQQVDANTDLAKDLIQVANLSYSINSLTLLNADGAIIASTDPSGESQRRAMEVAVPPDDAPVVTSSYEGCDGSCVSILVNVEDHTGRVGLLVAEVPVGRLLMQNTDSGQPSSGVSIQLVEVSGGEPVLLSSNDGGGVRLDANTTITKGSQDIGAVAVTTGQSSTGTRLVTAYVGIESAPWVLAVSLDGDSAYSALHGVRRALIVSFAVAILGLFAAAMLIGSWLTRRLQRVSFAVEAVTAGDLNRRVVDPIDDELGRISQAFDAMAEKLARRLSEERALRTRLEQQAFFDALTGLPNRHSFESHLDSALNRSSRDGKDIGVLFLDLDGFKRVNDSVGHAVGDDVLRALSVRLGSSMRAFDTVARWGGDEFVVLCESIETPHDALVVAQRLIAEVETPFEIAGEQRSISVSIGISVGNGKTHTRKELIDAADSAMYQAKELGRSQYVMGMSAADSAPEASSDARRDRIARALVDNELRVDFQPVVSLETGRLTGVEALVRWQHPERGLLGADEVLTAVKGDVLASRLDDWVLFTAISMFSDWRQKYPSASELSLAVNLGADRLGAPGLAEFVAGVLSQHGLAAESLCLEIPDTWLDTLPEQDNDVLGRLAGLGLCLALDGSGAMSNELLDGLDRRCISIIKLDRSLLRAAGDDDAGDLERLIGSALKRDLTVIAEGVEWEYQLGLLRGLGCQLAQGYYYSKPLAVFAIEQQISVMADAGT